MTFLRPLVKSTVIIEELFTNPPGNLVESKLALHVLMYFALFETPNNI
jgi:hypothetical protein